MYRQFSCLPGHSPVHVLSGILQWEKRRKQILRSITVCAVKGKRNSSWA